MFDLIATGLPDGRCQPTSQPSTEPQRGGGWDKRITNTPSHLVPRAPPLTGRCWVFFVLILLTHLATAALPSRSPGFLFLPLEAILCHKPTAPTRSSPFSPFCHSGSKLSRVFGAMLDVALFFSFYSNPSLIQARVETTNGAGERFFLFLSFFF